MFNKSLDNILGTFTKVQADLASFIERTKQESDQLTVRAAAIQAEAESKKEEVVRATAVIQKIDTLIN